MKTAMLSLGIVGTLFLAVHGADGENYWETIVALAKNGTARGKHELDAYLKSLTRDQMLTAARQNSTIAERTVPREDWAVAAFNVIFPLAYYSEPGGGLSDESLDKLLAVIADQEEGEYFRFALARIVPDKYSSHLTASQHQRVVKTLSLILRDETAPERLRHACCDGLRTLLPQAYRAVVYSDPTVREIQRTGPRERFQNVFSLIDAGEVQLAEETKARLVEPRKRIHAFRDILTAIAQDETEPERLRRFAGACLTTTAALPLLELEPKEPNEQRPWR